MNDGRHMPITNPSSCGGSTPSWVASLAFGENFFLCASSGGTGKAKPGENKLLLPKVELYCHVGVQVLWRGKVAVSWVG